MVVRSRNGVTTVQDASGEREEPGTAVDVLRREFAHRKLAAAGEHRSHGRRLRRLSRLCGFELV